MPSVRLGTLILVSYSLILLPVKAETSIGTAVSLNVRGELLTNRHVVDDCKSLAIRTRANELYPARTIAKSNKFDLAAISVEGYTPERIVWLSTNQNRYVRVPTNGMRLLYGGFDTDDAEIVDIANGEAVGNTSPDSFISQMRSSATHGASGSGVFDQTGGLIGIVFSGRHDTYPNTPGRPWSYFGKNLVNFYNNNAVVEFLQSEARIEASYLADAPLVPRDLVVGLIFAASVMVVCER